MKICRFGQKYMYMAESLISGGKTNLAIWWPSGLSSLSGLMSIEQTLSIFDDQFQANIFVLYCATRTALNKPERLLDTLYFDYTIVFV